VTPDRVNPPPEGGWESLKVDDLKAELEARGLPKSGNKAELVARLADDDVAQAGSAPAPAAEKEAAPEPDDGDRLQPVPAPESDEAQEAGEDAAAAADADEEAAEEQPRQRRRGSAETSAGAARERAPRPDGDLIVRARAKYVRSAPRKARLVMDNIRGKRVEQAQAILAFAPRAVSSDILKLLNSAIANAESAYELGADELTVRRAYVDEGPTIKRYRPRALGRATRINKRTSHMTIELTTTEGNGR
jgi:large subunit ribosomal protein L22